MLKFKKIELLTKTDKNPLVNQNMDAVTRRLQEIWLVVLRRERGFFKGGWGLVVCSWGELRWGRRRRNRGGEGRQRGDILTFADGFTDDIIPSVIPSASLKINRARHRAELSFWIHRWFRRHCKRWIGHVTVRSCRFESLGDSVGKNHSQKPPRKRTTLFFLNYQHSVRNSVGNYWLNLAVSVYR